MRLTQSQPSDPLSQDSISDIERLLCSAEATGSLESVLPRSQDAWSVQFPSLAAYADRPEGNRPIRICIATDQVAGPVRNGGIGNTYAALANLLAEAGFDITVLYLRGSLVETETIEHWVDFYAAKNVKLVPVPDYASREKFTSDANRWFSGPYNMMRYLVEHPMDVVHVSEWRGSGYLSLLAKRQGLAFADTLFVVKTSSPWMWNRLYGSHAIEKAEDIVKVHAERRSVELADIVVGGSLHLLRWMSSQGYAIPRKRAFVQPNVATFATLEPLMQSRALPGGKRTSVDEFVFFGRLEARKGLFLFCQAIRRLIRKGIQLPPKITFMGKPGGRMASHPDQDTPDYIRAVTEHWPTKVEILSDFQQYEAVEYLLGGARLAVMPSIIENSSMAIYEAAICGIPTVATDVGGNAELIAEADHQAVLCQPHPVSLGDKLEEALRLGGMVPRPSFDNRANLATWGRIHRQFAGSLREELLEQSRLEGQAQGHVAAAPSTAVCIYYIGNAIALGLTLASLAAQQQRPKEVFIAVDAENNADLAEAAELLALHGFAPRVVDAFDFDAGQAFNAAAARANSTYLLFLWEGATLTPMAIGTLEAIAAQSGSAVLTYLHRVITNEKMRATPPELRAVIIGGPSDSFFRNDTRELPLFVAREAFNRLDGFTKDYRATGYDHELVAKALISGFSCETAMIELGAIQARSPDWMRVRGYDLAASGFRATRPKLAAAPLVMRDLLLYSRGMHLRGSANAAKAKAAADASAAPETVLVRMMAGLATHPSPAAGRPVKPDEPQSGPAAFADSAAEPPNSAEPAGPAAITGGSSRQVVAEKVGPAKPSAIRHQALLGLLDRYEPANFLAGKQSADLPKKSAVSEALEALMERRAISSDGKRAGQFLGVHDGRLYGWAAVPGSVRRHLDVELVANGTTTIQRADQHFAPFAALPPEAARHGFVLDLPFGGAGWPIGKDGRPERIHYAIKIAGTALVLTEGQAVPPATRLDRLGIEADWEANDMGLIHGWAWHPKVPERRVVLAAFANGSFLARFRADRERSEEQTPGGGQGDYGFQLLLPRALRDAGRHRIDLVVADIGVPLRQSPAWAEGLRVDVTKRRGAKVKPR